MKSNPSTMTVRGKASDSSPEFKAAKTRSWHQQTIGQIVTQIAGEHGQRLRFIATFTDRLIEHIDQENESDAHFMTRLGKLYGAVAKPADGRLLFIPEGAGISTSGQALSAAIIDKSEITSISATIKSAANTAASSPATATKRRTARSRLRRPRLGKPAWARPPCFATKNFIRRGTWRNKPGRPSWIGYAAGQFKLTSQCPAGPTYLQKGRYNWKVSSPMAGEWIVKTVTHTLGNGGFTTKVSAGSKPE